jgi:hypothetical protein
MALLKNAVICELPASNSGGHEPYILLRFRFLLNAYLTVLSMTYNHGNETDGACSTYWREMHTNFS